MAFTTLVTRYPGKCSRCGESFPVGTRIRYGGRGRSYHFVSECAASDAVRGSREARDDSAFDRQQAAEARAERQMDMRYAGERE